MPLSSTLPPWLTQTPDPSAIIGRGSAAGGQAANARMDAERVMAQREQFAQEFTLRQAKLDMEAEAAAAMLAARDQELEIRKLVAESDIAKDAQQSLRLAKDYELRAKQSADVMMAKYATLKQQREIADAANANRLAIAGVKKEENKLLGEQAIGLGMEPTRISPAGTTYEKPKPPKDDASRKKLESNLRGAEAELKAAESEAKTGVVNPWEKSDVATLKSKVVNLRAQLNEEKGTDNTFTKGQRVRQDGKLYEFDGTSWQEVK